MSSESKRIDLTSSIRMKIDRMKETLGIKDVPITEENAPQQSEGNQDRPSRRELIAKMTNTLDRMRALIKENEHLKALRIELAKRKLKLAKREAEQELVEDKIFKLQENIMIALMNEECIPIVDCLMLQLTKLQVEEVSVDDDVFHLQKMVRRCEQLIQIQLRS